MAGGYGTVMKFKRDREADDAVAEDRAFQRSQRERMTRKQGEEDALEAGAATAAKPLAMEEQTATDVYESPAAAQGFLVGGQRYGDRGVAEKAVAAGNTAEGVNNRVAGFYRSAGKIDRASQIDASTRQAKASDMSIKQAEGQMADQDGLKRMVQLVAAGDAAGIANEYNQRYNDGQTAKVAYRPDGMFDVALFDKDGNPVGGKQGMAGDELVAQMAAKYDPKLYMAGQQQQRAATQAAERQKVEDGFKTRGLDIQEQGVKNRGELQAAQAEAARARAEAAQVRAAGGGGGAGGAGAAPQAAPVWDDKASAFLRQVYGRDPTIGRNDDDGAGMVLAKTIALAISQRNGGDLDIALGQAIHKDNELKALAKLGVRGVRLNLVSNGIPDVGAAVAQLQETAARVGKLGWHIQIFALPSLLAGLAPAIADLGVDIVIDHMGAGDGKLAASRPGFDDVLALLRAGKAWVKVSGANRVSRAGGAFEDAVPVIRALVEANPERAVWGTDWPHIGPHKAGAPEKVVYMGHDNRAVLRLLGLAVSDAAVIRQVLVDNPAKLYGF
jgi:predicted TIM-barrel fold metal-dependent hydrolase